LGGLDESCTHAILVKAQMGMGKLPAAWHATLPVTSLLPARLTLTTTKTAALARAELGRMRNCMRMDAGVARVAGLPSDAHDGLCWLRRCLPDGLPVEATSWIPSDVNAAGSPPAARAHMHCAIM
jgi:hypothetical protein